MAAAFFDAVFFGAAFALGAAFLVVLTAAFTVFFEAGAFFSDSDGFLAAAFFAGAFFFAVLAAAFFLAGAAFFAAGSAFFAAPFLGAVFLVVAFLAVFVVDFLVGMFWISGWLCVYRPPPDMGGVMPATIDRNDSLELRLGRPSDRSPIVKPLPQWPERWKTIYTIMAYRNFLMY
ncbi:MAG: hypothetical protein R3C40_01775 [Parvularculaceae bacterium]